MPWYGGGWAQAGCSWRWSAVSSVPSEEGPASSGEPGELPGELGFAGLRELFRGSPGAVRGAPAALARACVDLMDVSGASISLHGGSDVRVLWWSSDVVARQLAEVQFTLGDGPCRTVVEEGVAVFASDLTADPDAGRWPLFAQEAARLGVDAVFCLPLRGDSVPIGTLDLYRDRAGPLSERDLSFALPAADAITTALFALQSPDSSAVGDGSWLDDAETDHEEVHQATGMIMVQLGVDPPDALARLRAHAFSHGQSVSEAAFDVIAGRIRFHD
ncbi:GAF and ANTAR domain-containing protein [Streptomyces sp. NPDC054865]